MFWQLKISNKSARVAEQKALRYLKQQGLQLLTRNFACRTGEVDLIMLDQTTLVFIEVRYRSNTRFSSIASTITPSKQTRIRKTAAYYRQKHRQHNHRSCRFDAITVCGNDGDTKKSLEWIKSAFN